MKSVLTPVMSVTKIVDNITHKDLSVRIKKQIADEEMEHLIDSFNVMISRLEKSFGHISEFSSHVAHELKTPLAVIRGEIELALEQGSNPEEYKNVMTGCLEEIGRMNKVINDLLLLARFDYNPDVFRFEKLDLSQFLAEIHEQSKVLALPKNIKVNAEFSENNIFIKGDKVHLGRLFLNLINNAVKFTPQKGVVSISVSAKNKTAYTTVSDTGEGISERNLPKIFDRFFRVRKNESASEFGSGLGLNIALAIAKAHNGDITVKSRLGQGAAFTITFPII